MELFAKIVNRFICSNSIRETLKKVWSMFIHFPYCSNQTKQQHLCLKNSQAIEMNVSVYICSWSSFPWKGSNALHSGVSCKYTTRLNLSLFLTTRYIPSIFNQYSSSIYTHSCIKSHWIPPSSNLVDPFLARPPFEIFFPSLLLPLGCTHPFYAIFPQHPHPFHWSFSLSLPTPPFFLVPPSYQSNIQLLIYSSHHLTYHTISQHITSYFTILFELTDIVTECFPEDNHKVNTFTTCFITCSPSPSMRRLKIPAWLYLHHSPWQSFDYMHICSL